MISVKKNVIKPKEIDLILNVIKAMGPPLESPEDDSSIGYYGESDLLNFDIFAYGIFRDICERVLELAKKEFNLSLELYQATIAKVVPGNLTKEHTDCKHHDGTTKVGCGNFCISAVAYLNQDFTGGDLVFTKMEHNHKPIPGDCIIFPSHSQYDHYVDSVLSGERISLVMMFSGV